MEENKNKSITKDELDEINKLIIKHEKKRFRPAYLIGIVTILLMILVRYGENINIGFSELWEHILIVVCIIGVFTVSWLKWRLSDSIEKSTGILNDFVNQKNKNPDKLITKKEIMLKVGLWPRGDIEY